MSSSNSRKSNHSTSAASPMPKVENHLLGAPPPCRTPDDHWSELVVCEVKKEITDELMTLEDFLIKVGAPPVDAEEGRGMEDDVKPAQVVKRRNLAVNPLEKAAQQRHRRMIKNRESAARSRERKQAYQVELETLAGRLQEENEELLREKAERTKRRLAQLMEKEVTVVDKPAATRVLRRVQSWQW
ncbi:hypothetical protein MLD38_001483 [Melastoma candidum]|uniref:Uncharacterized protein n=1 Tax=Melastoma candidum TaxID=119954 RepID=A0ACB9SCV2_9MYRT|nr:hypothetical protein MLD38_001483 [Melastoma candidum]